MLGMKENIGGILKAEFGGRIWFFPMLYRGF